MSVVNIDQTWSENVCLVMSAFMGYKFGVKENFGQFCGVISIVTSIFEEGYVSAQRKQNILWKRILENFDRLITVFMKMSFIQLFNRKKIVLFSLEGIL